MNLFKRLIKMRVARDPEWKAKLERLKERLALLASDDPLVPLLQDLVKEFAAVEVETGCRPQIGDEEAHRFRGRLGMCVEFHEELGRLWNESRKPVDRKLGS
jgi:hypothetical protein